MKRYRLIYQMDSSGVLPAATDVNDYLKGIVGFLEDSHIDCLFWHDGAGGNTANYDSDVLELTGERIGEVDPSLLRLIEEGNDPPKIVVPAAKERGVDIFYSFRVNDCHDSFGHERLRPTFQSGASGVDNRSGASGGASLCPPQSQFCGARSARAEVRRH